MSYLTIDKFDTKFIERTKQNLDGYKGDYEFTQLINSLIGLIIIPIEFHKKGKGKYKVDFLNQPISAYPTLSKIFSGEVILRDEHGKEFQQLKFFYKQVKKKKYSKKETTIKTIDDTTVGDLFSLFRNGIAHANITPVRGDDSDKDKWQGIIVKNLPPLTWEKQDWLDVYLNEEELKTLAMFITENYK